MALERQQTRPMADYSVNNLYSTKYSIHQIAQLMLRSYCRSKTCDWFRSSDIRCSSIFSGTCIWRFRQHYFSIWLVRTNKRHETTGNGWIHWFRRTTGNVQSYWRPVNGKQYDWIVSSIYFYSQILFIFHS